MHKVYKHKKRGILEALVPYCPIGVLSDVGLCCQKIIEPLRHGYFKCKKYLRFLEDSQWWAKAQLEEYQMMQLKKLLNYIYKNVPYYRELFLRKKLLPDDFKSVSDLQKLPILSKQDIINNFDKLLTQEFSLKEIEQRAVLNTTSGSTGEPLVFYQDRKTMVLDWLYCSWRNRLANIGPFDKYVRIWSKPFVAGKTKEFFLYEPYHRRLSLSAIAPDENRLKYYLRLIKNFKPTYIIGLPSFLYTLANYAEENNCHDIRFRVFFSVSENLFHFQRNNIEKQFRCEVFSYYGSEENSILAVECDKHQGMHIDMRRGVTEIVGEEGAQLGLGNRGKIIYTKFNNYLMPLVRYGTGDLGIVSKVQCPCGRHLPVLEALDGRANEVIMYNGKYIYATALSVLMEEFKTIKECQFEQREKNKIILNIMGRESFRKENAGEIINKLKLFIDKNLDIAINQVDRIARTKAGKFKFVINYLNKDIIEEQVE